MTDTESRIFTVSWRGLLALLIIATACVAVSTSTAVPEWFQALVASFAGYYAGQRA